jgi:hypothetical protein
MSDTRRLGIVWGNIVLSELWRDIFATIVGPKSRSPVDFIGGQSSAIATPLAVLQYCWITAEVHNGRVYDSS